MAARCLMAEERRGSPCELEDGPLAAFTPRSILQGVVDVGQGYKDVAETARGNITLIQVGVHQRNNSAHIRHLWICPLELANFPKTRDGMNRIESLFVGLDDLQNVPGSRCLIDQQRQLLLGRLGAPTRWELRESGEPSPAQRLQGLQGVQAPDRPSAKHCDIAAAMDGTLENVQHLRAFTMLKTMSVLPTSLEVCRSPSCHLYRCITVSTTT